MKNRRRRREELDSAQFRLAQPQPETRYGHAMACPYEHSPHGRA
jgi:hypothetical protein